jgi:hypothetical protein
MLFRQIVGTWLVIGSALSAVRIRLVVPDEATQATSCAPEVAHWVAVREVRARNVLFASLEHPRFKLGLYRFMSL